MAEDATAKAFYAEMKRFLPSARVAQMSQMNLHRTMFSRSADLVKPQADPVAIWDGKPKRTSIDQGGAGDEP